MNGWALGQARGPGGVVRADTAAQEPGALSSAHFTVPGGQESPSHMKLECPAHSDGGPLELSPGPVSLSYKIPVAQALLLPEQYG